jgi:GT2 family glycosyltransferase/glycosyltransferase involved in cell wall biosynthesis
LLSVIIPVFNQCRFTIGCLKSIKDVLEESQLKVEVIVVDDKSTDQTKEVLSKCIGIRTLTNEENVGFIASCNRGAAAARGKHLLFLNNDTIVRPRCFEEILATFELKPDAGLVGAKLLYPDGKLQEAGGIIWNDGSGWNYGRMDDPEKPEYSYLREVDYCSGACLAVPRLLFERLDGFDTRYLPAYCEDSDLAFRVRRAGFKVYYQPLAQIIHFEGMTSGRDVSENVKSYQVINQQKLFFRWSRTLSAHGISGTDPYTAKERQIKKRMLVLDACVLTPDQDAGSLTVYNHIKIFQSLGYKVTFAPDNLQREDNYTSDLQRLGIECLYYPHTKSMRSHLETYGSYYDIVFIARAGVAHAHIDNIKTYCPRAKILFDTEDLHFLREARRAELENDAQLAQKALVRKKQELGIARKSDCTIVVSQYEKEILLKEDPNLNVVVIPVPRDITGRSGEFEERRDILFIGGFQHPPNVDAILYFVRDIYPLIKQELPDIKFYVLGSKPPAEVVALATDSSIVVTGYIDNLAPFFNRCRLSIAPLRYGAGVKGKILTSLSYGLPVVASSVACEGIGLENNVDVLRSDEPSNFAANVVRLYNDATLWNKLSENGLDIIAKNYSVAITTSAFQKLFASLTDNPESEFQTAEIQTEDSLKVTAR